MFCSKCGSAVAEGAAFCASCGQPVPGAAVAGPAPIAAAPAAAATPVLYAGFWLRFVAALIDGIILGIPFGAVFFMLFASALPTLMHQPDPMTVVLTFMPRILALGLIYLAGSWLYWALMESSVHQATLGKMALGLYVTDLAGNRAMFGKTSGRFFAGRGLSVVPYMGGLYFLISCITAGLSEKKQALHDMIASCLVLRKA
jgi:uncharacterized RDD family membrane protein YckC